MENLMKTIFLFFILNINIGYVYAINDVFFVNEIILSDTSINGLFNEVYPGPLVENISNNDDIIFYNATIGVLHPTQKQYQAKISVVDKAGNIIIQGPVKTKFFPVRRAKFSGESFKVSVLTMTLDPSLNAMVPGQISPLKIGQNYYIKLFIENQLLGVTKFHYAVKK